MARNTELSRNGAAESLGKATSSRSRVRTPEGEAVKLELPWVAALGDGMKVYQLVLEQYADAVETAVELYMECRQVALRSMETMDELNLQMWKVLQAAHPSPFYQ